MKSNRMKARLLAGSPVYGASVMIPSPQLVEMLAHAGFDWVLIDSPPVMAVADACVIAHRTTGVIFVVSADTTSRHTARQALEQLAQGHARVIGGVLNRVDLKRNPYYYAKYYRKEYSNYYAKTAS